LTAKGWTQSELARRADVGKDMISTYVRGRHLPDANNAKKLADAFGITVEELFPEIAGADPTPIDTPFELRAIPGTTDKVFVRVGIAMEMSHSDAIRLLRLTQSGVLPDA
jgi:transcriptional regulator with XRE-family HTH domain